MTMIVPCNDLQSSAHRESNTGHERIPEPNTIDVMTVCRGDHGAHLGIARDEALENGPIDPAADRHRLPRRAGARFLRCRFDVASNEPATDPAERNLVHRSGR